MIIHIAVHFQQDVFESAAIDGHIGATDRLLAVSGIVLAPDVGRGTIGIGLEGTAVDGQAGVATSGNGPAADDVGAAAKL